MSKRIGIDEVLKGTPYQSYLYSYPHKTSYRPLATPTSFAEAWADEDVSQLFLYMHVPFCEMRCGFCNLFTSAKPKGAQSGQIVSDFVSAIERQAAMFKKEVPAATFTRLAIGGGTPTYLDAPHLRRLFAICTETFGMDLREVPSSVETSPETANRDRLQVLADNFVKRVSIGVQSFDDQEIRAIGRAQKRSEVRATLARIREFPFPTLNIDLMYGLPGQDEAKFKASIDEALEFSPEEVYLYPLYVRPLTGVARLGRSWDDERLDLYRFGRDYLRSLGYQQASMRMFAKEESGGADKGSGEEQGEDLGYSCQQDGMVGLGPGARSYTRNLHYSSEYAVGAAGVREIIASYSAKSDDELATIDYGIVLDEEEERRRFLILSLLHKDGLDLRAYQKRFGSDAIADYSELRSLVEANLAQNRDARIVLADNGFERADAIGPWLHSPHINALMGEYDLR